MISNGRLVGTAHFCSNQSAVSYTIRRNVFFISDSMCPLTRRYLLSRFHGEYLHMLPWMVVIVPVYTVKYQTIDNSVHSGDKKPSSTHTVWTEGA